MEQKYAAWAEQLCTAGRSTVLVWAELVLSCPSAPQAPWWAQLGVKHHTHVSQPCRAQRQGATVHVYQGMTFLPSCFPNPFPLLSYWCIADPPSGPESENFPTVPPNNAQEFWALLSLALAGWPNGTGHHPISLAISVPSACLGLAPHSSYAPSHLLGSSAE